MLLPNAERAIIEPAKLHGYLLSTSHPVGRFKARFFMALGFTGERWEELETALRTQHLSQDVALSDRGAGGLSYTIRAILKGPAAGAEVVSVWWVRDGEEIGRFVTAYPGART